MDKKCGIFLQHLRRIARFAGYSSDRHEQGPYRTMQVDERTRDPSPEPIQGLARRGDLSYEPGQMLIELRPRSRFFMECADLHQVMEPRRPSLDEELPDLVIRHLAEDRDLDAGEDELPQASMRNGYALATAVGRRAHAPGDTGDPPEQTGNPVAFPGHPALTG